MSTTVARDRSHLYVVTGTGFIDGDGVYEEDGAGGGWYRREEPSSYGYYWFLYPVSGGRWALGDGRTYSEREAWYRAGGGEAGPQDTGWEWVRNGGRRSNG